MRVEDVERAETTRETRANAVKTRTPRNDVGN